MQFKTVCIFGASFLFFTSIAILIGKDPAERLNMDLSIYAFCEKYGYKVQNISLVTEDGYILTMHRIRCPRNQTNCKSKEKQPPVFLMHGILGSSIDFIAAGPNISLAFQLVDKGYDVWLGNQRGNTYSREHIMLEGDSDSSFWDFSFHEIGFIDIPTMIDYIIAETNFSKISYVGLSQGSLGFIIMTTLKPEYNDKILLSNLLGPVTTMYNTRNFIFKIWASFNFIIEPVLNFVGSKEVGGNDQFLTKIARYLCNGPHIIGNWICTESFMKHLFGASDQMNYDILPFYLSNSPAGASSKQFQHFVQNKIKGQLALYDYYDKNEEHYNQATPPIYNLKIISAPLAVYYSRGDVYINIEELYQELRAIPNVVLKHKVPYAGFNHMDYIFAKDLNVLVNNKIIEMINKYNKRH